MTDRPILFRPDMVNAILSGRKHVTRRAISLRPPPSEFSRVQAVDTATGEQFATLRILSVGLSYIDSLTDAEARMEGFDDESQLRAALREIYPHRCVFWRIEFEVER